MSRIPPAAEVHFSLLALRAVGHKMNRQFPMQPRDWYGPPQVVICAAERTPDGGRDFVVVTTYPWDSTDWSLALAVETAQRLDGYVCIEQQVFLEATDTFGDEGIRLMIWPRLCNLDAPEGEAAVREIP